MVAEVAIELERREDVVLVPSRAVLMTTRTSRERVAHVYVEREGSVHRQEVELGRRYPGAAEEESRVEIVRGLEGGEAVVVEGQHVLRDGARVRVAVANVGADRGRSERGRGVQPEAERADGVEPETGRADGVQPESGRGG
jgi:multidrug efflux pump subunit AcrA (membrane-fusion protein)